MNGEINTWEYILNGALTLLLSIVGFFTKRVIQDVDKMKQAHSDCKLDLANSKLDLANFKTEVSDNYVKQNTLERLHDRIDEVQRDIKTILQRTK